MGVHGLTTYLRENTAAISSRLAFSTGSQDLTPFVIDGWSFIYEVLALSDLPWVYGGEYAQISQVLSRVVEAWLSVGIRLYFVFDGPYPAIKFTTLTSRMTQSAIQPSLLFFRTSPMSRSTPRFLNESAMMPPQVYTACVQTLQQLAQSHSHGTSPNASQTASPTLEIHFADEEGDPYAVELAARLGAYVVGNDSDFVVLNAEGYKGYVPMDEMVWTAISSQADTPAEEADESGFRTVLNAKTKKRGASQQTAGLGWGIIPPEDTQGLQLSVSVYSPSAVASHLRIPLSLLPLLGALVGNDFSRNQGPSSAATTPHTNLQWLFFDRHLTLSQRITRVATTLRNILDTALVPSVKGKPKQPVSSVMELIERAVTALTVRPAHHLSSGERDRIIEKIVEATLQYAIPRYEGAVSGHAGLWTSPVCALHSGDLCPLWTYLSHPPSANILALSPADLEATQRKRARVRELYVNAYRSGQLDPHIFDVLNTGTFWYRQFLENPDLETVSASIGRPIQEWVYAILEDGLGLPEKLEEDGEEGEEADEDELIDVVEESDDEDPLAPLQGALKELDASEISEEAATEPPGSVSSSFRRQRPIRPKVVVEYVRRGTRLAPEDVTVLPLSDRLRERDFGDITAPVQLSSEEKRMTFFLRVLHSDIPSVRSLPPEHLSIALTLRWVLWRIHTRSLESNGRKDREAEKWSKQEARALLASFMSSPNVEVLETEEASPPILDRNIQLMAQIAAASVAIENLASVLLLSRRSPSPVLRFSGKTFHAYLTGTAAPGAIPDTLWNASTDGLESAFSEIGGKKKKKKDRKDQSKDTLTTGPGDGRANGNGRNGRTTGMFSLLADMDG